MYRDREVCFVSILSVGFLDDYGRGNQLSEVVHAQLGKGFLVNVLHLFLRENGAGQWYISIPQRIL